MQIEAVRRELEGLVIQPKLLASLRETASLASTHFSTQIEGNRLTLPEVEKARRGAKFPGRERDEREVKHHFTALAYMEQIAEKPLLLSEREIQTLHALVMTGKPSASAYRTQQNVIRESGSGRIVYLPPEAADVPQLMADLVTWVNTSLEDSAYPVPIIAALAHYQFATIHPYLDGNGRTARLLTTLILRRAGYGLGGIYSLDEHYATNLSAYYNALSIGHHNYYEGRADADVTSFVSYFCDGMDAAFAKIRAVTQKTAAETTSSSDMFRELDPRQRKLLALFAKQGSATSEDIAKYLKLSQRTVVALCRDWVRSGFLELQNPSRKARSYRLGARYL
ncbi:MAG: Fic family protein [Parvibaculaceae bacterium]